MNTHEAQKKICPICTRTIRHGQLVQGEMISSHVADEIKKAHPDWTTQSVICRSCLANFRVAYVQSLLESEKGEITSLEQEVLDSLRQHEVIASNIEEEFEQHWSFGERLADRIATFGGSWPFLLCFAGFLTAWIVMNSMVLLVHPVDPYPYILLNLMLSCLAAIQAPIIMMSQNRQEAKDRVRSQHDYQVNLKAELEIRHLHEKIDHLISHQWERLLQIQKVQLEALSDLGPKK